ncbi:DUF4886 domain-containing protein [Rodentibacter trehalosifermentans]|uniref:SGNH/GDSL hydrolase family protein n=1 Tax=Rodentibacter trehalosifermentans TaxID=1908263 RepID=A0A1V3IVT7_9PAST|nr:DUF4886 domain-containing protein [Rodentibacter trehalosifermentans]OOF46218.1 hypothetical protein BKK51_03375 [Rodentibacter trehalosifermentans]OOF53934.1 hypothetical protein BKK53_00355 [Rodentibacter trehalosifermentans]
MKNLKTKLTLSILLLFTGTVSANYLSHSPTDKITGDVKKVVFYGNSFTYYNNNVSTHLRTLTKSLIPNSQDYKFRSVTISSGRLGWHKENLKLQNSLDAWDTVIFQGQSVEPISKKAEARTAFEKSAREMSNIAHQSGQRVVYFMSWSYPDKSYGDLSKMSKELSTAYKNIAKETQGYVAPVGLAFRAVQETYPDINLYAPDNKHPSPEGTYLSACVLFSVLYNQSPENGKVPEEFNIPRETILKLQRLAWETVKKFQQ